VPRQTDSLAEAARALTVLVGREGRRRLVAQLAERAGVDLSPAACWLIVRLHEDPQADVTMLCRSFDVPVEVGEGALRELEARGRVVGGAGGDGAPGGAGDGGPGVREVTVAGGEIVQRLIAERRASLARLCAGWAPEQHADLTRVAQELSREPGVEVGAPA
jgi:hypothetical protein